jgi:hypothetical protein
MMNLVAQLGSTEKAIQFINAQVNSRSGTGGPNLNAAAAAIAAAAAGASVTSDLAGSAAAGSATVCARPRDAGQVDA